MPRFWEAIAQHSYFCRLAEESGEITIDEFVSGCMQLHGPAKSLQLAKMSFENKAPDWPIMAVRWSLYDCVASGKLAGQGRPEAGFTSGHVFVQLPINVFDL